MQFFLQKRLDSKCTTSFCSDKRFSEICCPVDVKRMSTLNLYPEGKDYKLAMSEKVTPIQNNLCYVEGICKMDIWNYICPSVILLFKKLSYLQTLLFYFILFFQIIHFFFFFIIL